MYKLREKSTGMYYSDPVSAGNGVMTNFSWVGNTFTTKKEAREKWMKILREGVTYSNGKRHIPQESEFEIEDISPKAEIPKGCIYLTIKEAEFLARAAFTQEKGLNVLICDLKEWCVNPNTAPLEEDIAFLQTIQDKLHKMLEG